ncbi:uncharacterized protein [Apostichopus japonicus]|uniref:uncharacterized protein n=1 Tax=Stichopus japonicus TaxID=307972 RepID=UPI003AB1E0A7
MKFRLKQILPEFDSTAQGDALEFLGAVYTSSCTSCNQSQCKLLDEYFSLHTTNEMKWTSCNETWHCRANSYPVIPIYPSNKGYMSCLSMQGHLEVCLDCKDLEGFCESCTEMQGCTTPFPTEEVWQKTGGILHINAKNVLDRKVQ